MAFQCIKSGQVAQTADFPSEKLKQEPALDSSKVWLNRSKLSEKEEITKYLK